MSMGRPGAPAPLRGWAGSGGWPIRVETEPPRPGLSRWPWFKRDSRNGSRAGGSALGIWRAHSLRARSNSVSDPRLSSSIPGGQRYVHGARLGGRDELGRVQYEWTAYAWVDTLGPTAHVLDIDRVELMSGTMRVRCYYSEPGPVERRSSRMAVTALSSCADSTGRSFSRGSRWIMSHQESGDLHS